MGLVLGLLVCLQLANSQDVDPGRTTGLLAHEQLLLPHPGPLPQGEGEPLTVLQNAVSAGPLNVGTTVPPLPGGEGRSEGELGAGGSSPLVPTKASLAFDSLAELRANFLQPPPSARPWVYWFWLNGNVTHEGITADLEAMQRVGIGGAILFDVVQDIPSGPVHFGTAEWHELFQHTIAEAGRLGLQITLHNAAGWTGSGGPWITPDLAMQKVVSAKT